MTPEAVAAGALAVAAAFAGGVALGRRHGRVRLRRVEQGIAELVSGNVAHRVILPGDDDATRISVAINQLADAIQADREAARARDDARRRLLANISHDLRTPITSIAGYVDALQRGLGDEPERYLGVIGGKVDELAQLSDDLFYAARLAAGDLGLSLEPLDLAEAVRRSVLGFERELAGLGVRVALAIPEEPCVVAASPSAVARILSNLISNSVRHSEGMTEFGVTMTCGTAQHRVRVTNDGSRLPADAEHLFERGVAGPQGGAGLGLSIARELAEYMGAAVSAENAAGGGVTFTLTFPSAPVPEFSQT
jgi:signal transduction histidine kinase